MSKYASYVENLWMFQTFKLKIGILIEKQTKDYVEFSTIPNHNFFAIFLVS